MVVRLPVSGVAHDLLVRHPVAVSRRHEPSAQPVRADRFGQLAFQTGCGGALEQYLAPPLRTQPGALDRTAAVDLAKQRPGGDFG